MKKLYYLRYGYVGEIGAIVDFLKDKCDFEFSLHESLYLGSYFSYSGPQADKLTVGSNFVLSQGEYVDSNHACYQTLVDIQITAGKNQDKMTKYKFLKKMLSGIQGMDLIKDELMEIG